MEFRTIHTTDDTEQLETIFPNASRSEEGETACAKMLELFRKGDFLYFVYDHPSAIASVWAGQDGLVCGLDGFSLRYTFFHDFVHPEDLPFVASFEKAILRFQTKIAPEKRLLYKARYDYRIRIGAGRYMRILQQAKPIRLSENGKVIKSMVVLTDITNLKKRKELSLSFLGSRGEPSFFDVNSREQSKSNRKLLTGREREILKYLSQNKTSFEISKILFISPNTVANHRRNMMRKTNCHTSLQLVMKAMENRWI